MRRRIAAITVVALGFFQAVSAIMAPAALAAGAPKVTTPDCSVTDKTLNILQKDNDISISTDSKDLFVSDGGGTCADPSTFDLSALRKVIVKADGGSIRFDLEDTDDRNDLADYDRKVDYRVEASDSVTLDGGGIGDDRVEIDVTVTDDTFAAGTLAGDLYAGRFRFDGGDGDDTLDASRVQRFSVVAEGGDGNDHLSGGDDRDRLAGGDGNDRIAGGDGDDEVSGDQGNDDVRGGDGDDEVDRRGSSGEDRLYPGDGSDDVGSDEDDVVSYADSTRAVELDLRDSIEVQSAAGDDDLDAAPRIFIGSPYGDSLRGDSDANRLWGGAGADVIIGGPGADDLLGGDGNDELYGSDGDDRLVGGAGDDMLSGGEGNDLLLGGLGADDMFGGLGADTLRGGDGVDSASGGPATDLCVAETKSTCETV